MKYAIVAFLYTSLAASSVGIVHAQDEKKEKPLIVMVAGTKSHGYGSHEFNAGCLLMQKLLRKSMPEVEVKVHLNGWPKEETVFEGAEAILLFMNGGGGHPVRQHLDQLALLMDKGVGLICMHYAVEVPIGPTAVAFKKWIGGYYESGYSINPHWVAKAELNSKHPITNGVKEFALKDEWYYNMRFREGMKDVVSVLQAVPSDEARSGRTASPGEPKKHIIDASGSKETLLWATERKDGGRGVGFTGLHFHWNFGDPNFRRLVLNSLVWTAGVDVPKDGVPDVDVSLADLEANQDYEKPKKFKLPEHTGKSAKVSEKKKGKAGGIAADETVESLKVADGLEASVFAAEPHLLSPSNIDVDQKGRVWVAEIMNYRGHNGKRPEGDRILILEDTDGDGKADRSKVFYQGNDIDSPHGVCVFGDKVIVSAKGKVFVFTDADGDDKPDSKEVMFQGISGAQHDHGIHAFVFGPDGKLYFNFGNSGKQLKDKDGKPVVDAAGNEVNNKRKPYQEGMVFRCNLDGSEVETLAWNFRNNWEISVDSFGTVWQSDNDDDGNRGVRINYVMEFGNYGYKDEKTGAGWGQKRTGMSEDKIDRQWHLNDPGVVPNLLHTGAGSPTGIVVYEGDLLPGVFHNQVLHCDAGPNVVRSYPSEKSGAGYSAKTVDILNGSEGDRWFRPSDVALAPDGSLLVADWYDPGVGGHGMGDLEQGRVYRVAPSGSKWMVPSFDLSTAAGAAEALKNPNLSVRANAWLALHKMGSSSEESLQGLWKSKNPRHRARALWLLGKIEGKGPKYVDEALADEDPDIRITGIRLARQLDLDPITVVTLLASDPAPEVRRECAIALRHSNKRKSAAALWAELALQHDGRDRWYLEALGIGADGNWDACLAAWLKEAGEKWDTPAGRDLIWRSRAKKTPELLAKIVTGSSIKAAEKPRYMRAFDFLSGPEKDAALQSILLQ
jgi:putative membrane-bound dehydrogenase-like protein